METSLNMLKQTALDYDMPLNEVKRIYNNSSEFYNALEQYLIDRNNGV